MTLASPAIAPDAPARPALRYFGSKWRLAPWIVGHLPPHVCYVEPFGGSGSVLLRKTRSVAEVYNDLDGEVVNFFRVLREQGNELLRVLRLTPFSRAEFDLAWKPAQDPVERARRLYVLAAQSRGGGRTQWRTGWRYCRGTNGRQTASQSWADLGHLPAVIERLRCVQIEEDTAQAVIERFDAPNTLFYVDPPYLPDARSARWRSKAYTCEMSHGDHAALLQSLRSVRGMVVLSGYASNLYRDVLDGWTAITREARCDVGYRTEVLWSNPAATAAHRQLDLRLEEVAVD